MKCEHERICENCKLDGSRDCFNCFNGLDHRKFSCKLCKKNKPLTIAELKQMDGEPVWVTGLINTWHFVNCEERKLIQNNSSLFYTFGAILRGVAKAYKTKPLKQPRMVTIEQAIDEKLKIRRDEEEDFMTAIDWLKLVTPLNMWDGERWEVKEG